MKTIKVTIDYRSTAIALAALAAVASTAYYAVKHYRCRRAVGRAELELVHGFPALAVDLLEPYRHSLVSNAWDCKILVSAYYQAQKFDRLQWAAQACLEAGREIPEVFLALAASYEMTGREKEAVSILTESLQRIGESPAPYLALGNLYRKLKRDHDAIAAYRDAISRSEQDPSAAIELLGLLSELGEWDEARKLAERLIPALPPKRPDITLLAIRALIRGGNKPAAAPLLARVREELSGLPDEKHLLEARFPELLGPSVR
jgi:tetratricopeptide (TPR) repeat protein